VSKDTSWDHALSVAADAEGLTGHAGAVLLRKLADQVGLTAAPGPARAGKSPLSGRGVVPVSLTVAIALGATSMNDITLFHPLGAWCANTRESLAMLMRRGNAGSNTVKDHIEVLDAAIAQVPARHRDRLLVRIDGAGATRELVTHLLKLNTRCRTVLFTCGWTITPAPVILSFRVSRVCDLLRPVVDSVAGRTLAA